MYTLKKKKWNKGSPDHRESNEPPPCGWVPLSRSGRREKLSVAALGFQLY